MAIIQKIRDKYAKVAGGVIVLALVGFVLMDATSGGRSGGGLFGPGSTVAKVDGMKIDVTEYDAMVTAQEEQMRAQNRPMDENSSAQLRDQVLNQMIMKKLTDGLSEKLGITVSESELKEMLNAANPDPMVRQAFTNPQTGEYSAEQAASAIAQYEKSKDAKEKNQWDNFKNELVVGKTQSKLNALLAGSYYTPKFILDDQNEGRASTANISYVALPYTLVGDDKVKVTDDDINKYIAARKSMYEIKEETRNIEYVSLTIAPSTEDSNRVRTDLDGLKEGLATATDVDAFVKRNSATQIPVAYQTEENLQQMQITEQVAGAANGAVVGPFAFGTDMAIAKVMNRALLPDSVKVRSILVLTKRQGQQGMEDVRTEAQAQARIDSMIAQEKTGVPFDTLVARFSDGNNQQNPKGEFEIPLNQRSGIANAFGKEFDEFAFNGGIGASKVVKGEGQGFEGLHYVQIMNRGSKTVSTTQLAIVVKPLNADKSTYSTIYAKATEFANKVTANAKNFEKEATAAGLQVQQAQGLNRNSYMVQGLGASKDLINWAYDKKAGDVSPIFTVGGNKIVIAKLADIQAAGLMKPTGNAKLSIENIIRNQKKAAFLIAANKDKKSLADIAGAYQLQVGVADSLSFSAPMIPGLGNEPKVLGYTFNKNFKENTLSPGVAGMGSLYYIMVTARNKGAEATRDLKMERQMADMSMKGRAAQMILEGMRQSVDVKDLRYKLYK